MVATENNKKQNQQQRLGGMVTTRSSRIWKKGGHQGSAASNPVLQGFQAMTFVIYSPCYCDDNVCDFDRTAIYSVGAAVSYFLAGMCLVCTTDDPGEDALRELEHYRQLMAGHRSNDGRKSTKPPSTARRGLPGLDTDGVDNDDDGAARPAITRSAGTGGGIGDVEAPLGTTTSMSTKKMTNVPTVGSSSSSSSSNSQSQSHDDDETEIAATGAGARDLPAIETVEENIILNIDFFFQIMVNNNYGGGDDDVNGIVYHMANDDKKEEKGRRDRVANEYISFSSFPVAVP